MLIRQRLEYATNNVMGPILDIPKSFHLVHENNEVGKADQRSSVALLQSVEEVVGYLVKACKRNVILRVNSTISVVIKILEDVHCSHIS